MRRVEVGLSVKENKPDYITTFLTFVLVGMKSHEGGHVIGLARVLFADAFLRDEAVDELARSHVESGVPDLFKHMFILSHSYRNVSLDESTYLSLTAASVQAPRGTASLGPTERIRACTLRTLQTVL